MKKYLNSKNHGFTLVETLLIIIITLVISITTFVIYEKIQISFQVVKESRNMDQIRTATQTLYAPVNNYNGVGNQILNLAGIVPPEMQTEGIPTSITNSFGRAVVILPAVFNGQSGNGFSLIYLRVPDKICTKLISMVGMHFLTVNAANIMVKNVGQKEIDISLVSSACSTDTGNGVDIIFTST